MKIVLILLSVLGPVAQAESYKIAFPEEIKVIEKKSCGPNTQLYAEFAANKKDSGLNAAALCIRASDKVPKEICDKEISNYNRKTVVKTINGKTFYYDEYPESSLASSGSRSVYRTFHNGNCYQIEISVDTYINAIRKAEKDSKPAEAFVADVGKTFAAALDTFKFTSPDKKISLPAATSDGLQTIKAAGLPVTFQCPDALIITHDKENAIGITKGTRVGLDSLPDDKLTGMMSVQTYANEGPDELVKNELTFPGSTGPTDITLGGEPAKQVGHKQDSTVIATSHKGKTYRIFFAHPLPGQIEAAIKSFRFTE